MSTIARIRARWCGLLVRSGIALCFVIDVEQTHASTGTDAAGIATVAAKAANIKSLKLYRSAPFSADSGKAVFSVGHWHWHALATSELGALEVEVTLTRTGKIEKIVLQKLRAFDEGIIEWE